MNTSANLQANSNKLDAINETIRKYNNALALCREGHEDVWRPFIIPVLFSKHRTLIFIIETISFINNIYFSNGTYTRDH